MQFNELFDNLQKFTKIKPAVKTIATILDISEKALYARKDRGSEFSLRELFMIESYFALPHGSLAGVLSCVCPPQCVELYFYPDVFGSCGEGGMVFNETAENENFNSDACVGTWCGCVLRRRSCCCGCRRNGNDENAVYLHGIAGVWYDQRIPCCG